MEPEHPSERLGLSVPRGWWSSPPLLKSFEASGFSAVQVHSPPAAILAEARWATRHARTLGAALSTTGLSPVLHAPEGLRIGNPPSDRAFEGLLYYAAEIGATHVVYHACALPDASESQDPLLFERRSLARLTGLAERLRVTIAIENLAPVFPGAETLSSSPLTLRALVRRIGSRRLGICLDVGHAHIVANLRHASVESLIEPVLDAVTLFHLHDNFGARWRVTGAERGVDPLKLDLHLPPGRGTLPWERISRLLARHTAPLVLEVHPPYLPRPAELNRSVRRLLGARETAPMAAQAA
jgi:sugar phosphate isomerase/epimerase